MTASTLPKILFVDHTAVLGGAQLSLLDIATAMRHRSAVVLFEDGDFAAALVRRNLAVLPLSGDFALRTVKKTSRLPSIRALLASASVARELARIADGYSLLYSNSPKSFLISAAAGFISRKPVIWHLRDILDRAHFSSFNLRLMVSVANARAARVVANSRATADAFIQAGGNPDLVTVVYNGIDAASFVASAAELDLESVRVEFGIPARAFLVGSFSRLHPWKGPQVLLDALELIPDVHALIVGGALFSGEREFEAQLRARAQTPSLKGRVHITGMRFDVPRLMKGCDVVAHTSVLPEPFGRVLVEALLLCRPLIASNAGGVTEVVADQRTALLTPPGDARALADAILVLRENPAFAQSLAIAGREDVKRRFSRDAMLTGVQAVIDSIVS